LERRADDLYSGSLSREKRAGEGRGLEFALEWGNLSTTFSGPSIPKYSLLSCGGSAARSALIVFRSTLDRILEGQSGRRKIRLGRTAQV
jgi:hypothetical protein